MIENIKKAENPLILAHHNADIDAVGSSIALYEIIGGKGDLAVPDSISRGARELAEGYDFLVSPSLEGYDLLVILDCASSEQLGKMDVDRFVGKIIMIDHHSGGDLTEVVDECILESDSRSTAEIIYKLFGEEDINEKASLGILCGIIADTAHLKNADSKHFRYISDLLKGIGISYSEVLSILHTSTELSERIARVKAASRMEAYRFDETIVAFSSVGSYEAAAARALLRLGADVGIVFCPRKDEMRISGRCRNSLTEKIHLGEELFAPLEDVIEGSAGGHDAAASANGKNKDEEEIKNEMVKRLTEILGSKPKRL